MEQNYIADITSNIYHLYNHLRNAGAVQIKKNKTFTHFTYKLRKVWVNEKVDRKKVKGKGTEVIEKRWRELNWLTPSIGLT